MALSGRSKHDKEFTLPAEAPTENIKNPKQDRLKGRFCYCALYTKYGIM